jgi:hypothetical protein
MHRTTHQTAEKKATQALQWQEKAPYTESPCDCESILATAFATGNQHDFRLFKGNRAAMAHHIRSLADSGYLWISMPSAEYIPRNRNCIRLTKLRKTLIGERLGSTFW